ncbi:MAG TPA: hypothetical protein VNM69_00470 [Bacillus sp. (in: firmicutes)]|uniref:hypothetical protein n=1 Tax=Bacillus litorisediminis TaxID=2922713 RepID=UPI001FAF58C0|nr:hypothetical protein [Bacillus litorisediminis]HWO74369.1 hypothetical protein [Bacillus sp. (in: firmicutes)]
MVNITIEVHQYQGNQGHGYRSLLATDDNGMQLASDLAGMNPVDFIELAIQDVIKQSIAGNGLAQDITVNLPAEIVLTAGLQTHLIDKYSADPLVSSLAFA